MASVTNVNDLLEGHVTLDLECLDRIYLNAYIPNLQVSGQVVRFMRDHLHQPIASPAIFERIGNRFREAVTEFARSRDIPVLRFKKGDRRIDMVRPLAAQASGPGVVAIGVAQEFQWVFTAHKRPTTAGPVSYGFDKAERRVTCFYFYVLDDDFGLGFVKIASYFPYPAKVWVNGHEWAKRQAARAGLGYRDLANGFAACDDPAALQGICDRLGPDDIQRFFDRWTAIVPTPLTGVDHAGGYWWELSMRQVEVSRTLVFDAPRRARGFFEALVADNLDIGRPDEVKIIFGRQIRSTTKGEFATKVVSRGTEVTVNLFYKSSRIKQYLKEGRALRIETVVNEPNDLGCQRRLRNLDDLQGRARIANRRLLEVQRVGQSCAITTSLLERVTLPTTEEGQRAPALRFGDPRVMALAGALCALVHVVVGFTNRSLCARVSPPLNGLYTSAQMTYDLRRMRLKGLVRRVPHSNRYVLTAAPCGSSTRLSTATSTTPG
ncbi:MAG: hypothetical protein LC733_08130 [Actinobacteria bacterium]|nr:hypothetical protein [Actinomycetota bacterium]